MSTIRVVTNLSECRAVWEAAMPREFISDLWEVRECFHKNFHRPLHFIVAEDGGRICGLLPLSWIEESGFYGYFPGETWGGETWLEQNRIIARDEETLDELLRHCPGPYNLRYLLPPGNQVEGEGEVDEIGYLFLPPLYGYDMENYFREFSHKSDKRLQRDLAVIEALEVDYRYNERGDFEHLVRLNIQRFGISSYFADLRFTESFRSLLNLFSEKGWLRITTIIIDGEPAAVDMGCVRGGIYTLLGGGSDDDYPGIAKLINTHHMHWACEQKLPTVDFLCGDFAWKKLFHLTPRPLYLLASEELKDLATVECGAVGETHAG